LAEVCSAGDNRSEECPALWQPTGCSGCCLAIGMLSRLQLGSPNLILGNRNVVLVVVWQPKYCFYIFFVYKPHNKRVRNQRTRKKHRAQKYYNHLGRKNDKFQHIYTRSILKCKPQYEKAHDEQNRNVVLAARCRPQCCFDCNLTIMLEIISTIMLEMS
jgi:hypothetical protein